MKSVIDGHYPLQAHHQDLHPRVSPLGYAVISKVADPFKWQMRDAITAIIAVEDDWVELIKEQTYAKPA